MHKLSLYLKMESCGLFQVETRTDYKTDEYGFIRISRCNGCPFLFVLKVDIGKQLSVIYCVMK